MIAHGRLAKRVSSMKRYFVLTSGMKNRTAWIAVLTVMLITASTTAQKLQMPSSIDEESVTSTSKVTTSADDTPYSDESQSDVAVPASYSTAGMYYNPTLGSHIRARYNTQSYGQERGNLDLGTMRVWDLGDSVSFFDGQITLNEESHVGYNLGLGYRWMDVPVFPFSADNQKIYGVSLWTDGQGAGGDNFFPQIGLGFEILGDRTDFRTNVYIPLGPESQDRDFVGGGENSYSGNFLAEGLLGVRDTALTVVDGELAGRISDLEAWVFGGVYGYSGGEYDEVGGKVGLRGYATPDLALQIDLTNDAVFDTNAVFSATWFIGRTRRENRPTGALRDRFREPVIRNDYIALKSESVSGVGDILLDVNGDPIRIVHIDSTAAAGGDGTFESPFNTLASAGGSGSEEGDILLAHAGSTFTADGVTLQDNQRLLGEGVVFDDGNALTTETNIDHTVTVFGGGTESLPETATDAFTMAAPTITNTTETAVLLADNNEVNNLVIDGGTSGLMGADFDPVAGTNGSGDQNLQNLQISGTTGNAIELTMARRIDENDASLATLEMDINIANVDLNNIGGAYGVLINADAVDDDGTGTDEDYRTLASTTATNESTTINGLTIDGGTGVGLGIQNIVNPAANVNVTGYAYDGDGTGQGAIEVLNSSAGITFDNTNTITNTGGVAIMVDGNHPTLNSNGIDSTFAYNGSLTNAAGAGNSVTLQNINGGLTQFNFNGGLDDQGTGIDIDQISGGVIQFASSDSNDRNEIITTGTDNGITITNVDDSAGNVPTIEFNDFDITTADGTGIVAQRAAGTNDNEEGRAEFNDTIVTVTGSGRGIDLEQDAESNFQTVFNGLQVDTTAGTGEAIFGRNNNMTVAAGTNITTNTLATSTGTALDLDTTTTQGIAFDQVDVNGAANAIALNNVGDGPITIGSNTGTDGEGGTLVTTGNAVVLTNVDDFTIGDVNIATPGNTAIISSSTDTTDTVANNLTINNVHTDTGTTGSTVAAALDVSENASAAQQNVTVNDSNFNDATGNAVTITDVTGTVSINDTTIDDAGGSALVASGTTGNMALNTVSADNATATAMSFTNIDGTVNGNTVTIDGGDSNGIVVTTSDGTFTFDTNSSITDQDGVALTVNGGDGQVTYNGTIDNTLGRSVAIENKSGGGVTFTPSTSITDTGEGILVDGNTGGDYTLLANYDLDTGANDAVTVTNNTGSTVSFSSLDINTTTGNGFVASGGGTVGVNPGSSITTTTGTAINMNGVTVANTGITFDSVDVTGKATTSAVILNDLTGGSVNINGGTIADSTNDAITATDVQSLSINGLTVTDSDSDALSVATTGGNSTSTDLVINDFTVGEDVAAFAIDVDHIGDGRFDITLNNSNLDNAVSLNINGDDDFDLFASNTTIDDDDADVAFLLDLGSNVNEVDIRLTNFDVTATDATAFDLDINGGNTNIAFEISGTSAIVNNSAASNAFDATIIGTTNFDAMFLNNSFTANGTSDPFSITTTSTNTIIQADINGNTFVGGSLILDNNGGAADSIQIDDLASLSTDNGGVTVSEPNQPAVEFDETIETIESPVAND